MRIVYGLASLAGFASGLMIAVVLVVWEGVTLSAHRSPSRRG